MCHGTMVHGRFGNGTRLKVIHLGSMTSSSSFVLMNYDIPEPNAIAGCHVHVMAPMILDKLLIIACGIMVLLATASATQEEKRTTEQHKHAPFEHAQLISNDTTLKMTVSGTHALEQ